MFETHRFPIAAAKTLIRILRCRPPRASRSTRRTLRRGRVRRAVALSGIIGMLALTGMLFMGPAAATVTSGCYGKANGRKFESITQDLPLRVTLSQRIALSGGAFSSVEKYLVKLHFFGIQYGLRAGTTTDNKWNTTITTSRFATRGTGNYIVEGYLIRGESAFCVGRLYLNVRGNPLSETPGQAAAGITATAIVGMIATAIAGSKVPPGFESTTTPEEEEEIKQKQEEEKKKEEERKKNEENKKLAAEAASKKCVFLILPALLLMAGMVASGTSTEGAGSVRAIPWRPRLSFIGIGSGILLALGTGVLLQQYGVIWPTLGMGIAFLAFGIAMGIVVPSLARLRVVRILNRRFAALDVRYAGWTPTHVVPADGLAVWDQPDPSTEPREDIEAGVDVQLVQQRGDWAQVTTESGLTGWIDARQLEEPAVPAAEPAPAASTEATSEANEELTAVPADWYPDPSGEARLRYWDGEAWTEHTAE